MIDAVIALVLLGLWAVKRLSARAMDLYESVRKYGDPIHVGFGALVGRLFVDHNMPVLGTLLSLLYALYEYKGGSASDAEAAKDLAVFVSGLAGYVAFRLSIPFSF